MTTSGRRRMAEPVEDDAAQEVVEPVVREKKRGSRRAAFPTPGFKSFGTLLNLLTVPLASYQASTEFTLNIIVLGVLSIIGVGIALYSNALRPLATNVKTRKILTLVSLVYGFLLLIALLLSVIMI